MGSFPRSSSPARVTSVEICSTLWSTGGPRLPDRDRSGRDAATTGEGGIAEPGLGLHACRRVFATAFLHAGSKEEVAAKIMGHTINSMSYGTYVRKLDLAPALKAMRRALKFPRPPVYP